MPIGDKKIFRKILIPLDGSKLAECALPYAEALTKTHDTQEIILVSVTEQVKGRTRAPEAQEMYRASGELGVTEQSKGRMRVPEEFYHASGELGVHEADSEIIVNFGKKERQAQRYLSRIAKRIAKELEVEEISVHTEVLSGPPAQSIISYAEHCDADIIVMSSHDCSDLGRWAFGSVADRVLHTASSPLLLVKPFDAG